MELYIHNIYVIIADCRETWRDHRVSACGQEIIHNKITESWLASPVQRTVKLQYSQIKHNKSQNQNRTTVSWIEWPHKGRPETLQLCQQVESPQRQNQQINVQDQKKNLDNTANHSEVLHCNRIALLSVYIWFYFFFYNVSLWISALCGPRTVLVFRRSLGNASTARLLTQSGRQQNEVWSLEWQEVDLLPHVPARALQLKTPRLIYRLIFLCMQTCRHVWAQLWTITAESHISRSLFVVFHFKMFNLNLI